MPDNPAPRRRWYQLKLSTWFLLVALLAAAMVSPIAFDYEDLSFVDTTGSPQLMIGVGLFDSNGSGSLTTVIVVGNRRTFILPGIVAAFVGWKLYANRKRKPPATH